MPTLSGMPGECGGGPSARALQNPPAFNAKWVRKQIGLTIVAAGAMIVLLHGMVQLMV
ncbi:hypothetical protein ACU4HD_46655 [Cupriavidus basilensis]